jgi:hypothetical protein
VDASREEGRGGGARLDWVAATTMTLDDFE